jgi:hypothetical protein
MTIFSDWQIHQGESRMHRKGEPPAIIVDMTSDEEIRRRLAEKRRVIERETNTLPSGVGSNF